MYKDFHYYGTYVAAIAAGFSSDDAVLIAYAAQYVDDSSRNMLLSKKELGFEPIPTVETYPESLMAYDTIQRREIWIPFHFLPGNFDDTVEYHGVTEKKGIIEYWKYDKVNKKNFKLICLSDGKIVTDMVNDIIKKHSNKDYMLHLTGIRMHVLADAVSHNFFSGIPAWYQNEVSDPVYKIDGEKVTQIPYDFLIKENNEQCTPESYSFSSSFYLGHARVGSVPDYPWLKFKYIPQWNSELKDLKDKYIVKDNPASFYSAFTKMYNALMSIKNKKPFDNSRFQDVPDNVKDAVQTAINVWHDFGLDNISILPSEHTGTKIRCEAWKREIDRLKIDQPKYVQPPEYNPETWYIAAKGSTIIKKTNYYWFNSSALIHRNYVKDQLKKHKASYWDDVKPDIKQIAISPSLYKEYFLTNKGDKGTRILANSKKCGKSETFNLITIDEDNNIYAIQTQKNKYLYPSVNNIYLMSDSETIGEKEKFTITVVDEKDRKVSIRSYKNLYISAEKGGGSGVSVDRNEASTWETFIIK